MSNPFTQNGDEPNLLMQIQKGDEKSFEVIFRRYYAHLVMFAKRYVSDKDMAENIVQSVFVQFWEKRNKQEINSLKGFLVVAVRNRCHNELKHQGVVREYEKVTTTTTSEMEWPKYEETFYLNRINQVIDQLPEQRQKIFKMSRMDGLKYKEIAEKLSISPKTVEVQMGHALKYLRENLQPLKKQLLGMFL